MLAFLEEVNENIRFVRHQLRAFREGVRAVNDKVARYKDPEGNFTLYDALSSIDREWEYPEYHREHSLTDAQLAREVWTIRYISSPEFRSVGCEGQNVSDG